jgi:glutathione S-transferase
MSSLKPITLYSHATGPNPWKVAILLEELQIPYKNEFLDMAVMHEAPFTDVTPNGRVPAIVDPNTNITLWESGAIIEYLQETYDKSNTFTFTSSPEKFLVKQWLHFQMSGQGPYFGQAAWFALFHPERIESATKRYKDQIIRVVGVLDVALKGKTYLVGEKCTIADLSFVTWDLLIPFIFQAEAAGLEIATKYPNYAAWNARLMDRPAVKKVVADRQAAMAAKK